MIDYKVSIIVPVYNVERYLKTCMDTLVNQTLKEVEIIVVNDGSPDNSLEILKDYEQKYGEKVKVFTTENKGVSHARNYGIGKAAGEYIMFVDSDDYIELDMCEKLYGKAITDQNDLVVCARNNVYENESNGKITTKVAPTNLMSQNFRLSDKKFELAHISPFPWDKLFKKTLLGDFRFPENMRFEDLVLAYKVAVNAENIGLVEEPLYNYRRTTQGGFLNTFSEETLDIIRAFDLVFDYMEEHHFMEVFRDELAYICARHFLFRYPAFFTEGNTGKLELKQRIIHGTQDFMDERVPGWRKNHYLLYSSALSLKNKLDLYTNKKKLLKQVKYLETYPKIILKLEKNYKKFKLKWKKKYRKFKRSKNKKAMIARKLPFLKLFNMPMSYRYTKAFNKYTVKKDVILLESKHGADIAGNIFSILKELTGKTYEHFQVYLVAEKSNEERFGVLLNKYNIQNVKFVELRSKLYMELLASAGYLVTDTSFPPYYIKKEDQVYLNTWHGTPLKAMGKKVPSREFALGNVQRNFLIADYLLYQNEFSKNIFLTDYMIDKVYGGTVLLSGYPRNTAFFHKERYEQIRSESGLVGKQVMVYMPTWRGMLHKMESKQQIKEIYGYFLSIDKRLKDSQILFVKLHPYVKNEIDYEDFVHIKPFPEEYETYDFLNASDLLITDYSSIMFDYGVSKKKIILFTYDREEYLTGRGMYLDLNKVDLPKADTVKELIAEINNEEFHGYPEFFTQYCSLDYKDCTKEVCEKVFIDKKVTGLKTEKIQQNGKSNILVYINRMPKGDRLEELIKNLNGLDEQQFNYFVSFRAESLKKSSAALANLKDGIAYMPIQIGKDVTMSEKIASVLMTKFGVRNRYTKGKVGAFAKREAQKNYGELKFAFVFANQNWTDWMTMRLTK